MTAKEKVNHFGQMCIMIEHTFWFRMLRRAGKVVGFAGILWVGTVFLQVRDAVRDTPKLRREVDRHDKQIDAVSQKIGLILLNDNNYKIPTEYLNPIFKDIDNRAKREETE